MISVAQLTKQYGPHTAVSGLSFEVKKGEIVGFLGPNGAGKSTTMKILTGFMPATDGKATVAGYDVFENPIEVKRNVGFLPENPPVYPEMPVRDYLEFAARLHQVPSANVKAAVASAMEKTGLGHVQKRLIGNLSKGYRQRVGLAQALVHNPQVLVLDEPTVGLDPAQIIDIRDLIRSLGTDHTVILSSHILAEITETCQHIIMINRGRIVADDTLENLTSGGKRGYALTVKNPSSEGIEALRRVGGVKTVTATGPKLFVETGGVELHEHVLETVLKSGMGVLEFSSQRVSLEQIYLRLLAEDPMASQQPSQTA